MAGISRSEIDQVLAAWEAAGARVEPRKNKSIVYAANGADPYPVHFTLSDTNAHKNMRTWGRRNGLPWPFEYNHTTNSRAKASTMRTIDSITLPDYIEETAKNQLGVSRRRMGEIHAAIKQIEASDKPLEIKHIHDVMKQHGIGYPASAQASKYVGVALYQLGYRPVAQRQAGRGQIFTWAPNLAPLSPFLNGDAPLGHLPDLAVHSRVDEPRVTVSGDGARMLQGFYEAEHSEPDDPNREVMESEQDVPEQDERMVTHSEHDGHDHSELVEAMADSSDAAFWQDEAERLEAELVKAKATITETDQILDEKNAELTRLDGQLRDANEAFVRRGEQLAAAREALAQRAALDRANVQDDGWQTVDVAKLAESRDGYTLDELVADAAVFGLTIRVQRK